MLQYPVQLPPLSLSPAKVPHLVGKDNSDYFRSNDPPSTTRLPHNSLNNKRFQKEAFSPRPAFAGLPPPPVVPLSISTNLSSPSPTSSSPSTASFKLPRSPYLSSRQVSSPVPFTPGARPWSPKSPADDSRPSSIVSSTVEDVLVPGDLVGQGGCLQGETIRLVSIGSTPRPSDAVDYQEPAKEFEVVRRLGTGSYAVVYLVLEVLSRPLPSEDGHMPLLGPMEVDGKFSPRPSTVYGREYAIKCLSKANLDEEALAAQMSEVTIHQSLQSHPNIVTLHRTLETSSFLLLLLEYVPGEDLFYFLEQSRDHYESDSPTSTDSVSSSRTPPTPSLLSNLHPSQLLSRTRLRLISSMFSQMCDAVAACHAQQVYHRDIKPENFIVTDGFTTLPSGRTERKVVVKLTDFGLSTSDLESSDMDCGSAPYMSYECRNNVAPTYRPRAADVWSLGIVLINMLYHYNPWTDTTQWACASFDSFRQQPVNFFMHRFTGMTRPVAEFLASRVFCILDDPKDDSQRITAAEFGAWAKDLPALLGDQSDSAFSSQRVVSGASTQGHPISSSTPISHRPCSRHPSGSTSAIRTPAIQSRSLSRAPSLGPAYERGEASELSTVFDQEYEEQEGQDTQDVEVAGMESRSTSTNKRRKRGARRGKGSAVTQTPTTPKDETLATLAVASQSLAREISKASKASSLRSVSTKTSSCSRQTFEPVSMYPVPTSLLSSLPPLPPLPTTASNPPAPVAKKPSKWKLSFGKASAPALNPGSASPVEEMAPHTQDNGIGRAGSTHPMSATASNVTNLIMGLSAPAPQSAPAFSSGKSDDSSSTWSRGRRTRGTMAVSNANSSRSRGPPIGHDSSQSPLPSVEHWANATDRDRRSDRAISPNSTRSGRPIASSASSMVSGNWRNSTSTTSSAGTSTSAFTRYSNSSMRSISTTATSVSSTSWRTNGKPPQSSPPPNNPSHPTLPKNIKFMTGVPWELNELPRGLHPNPVGDIFGSPPVRKQRTRKPKDIKLDTITERPLTQKSPEHLRRDASTSTTDLSGIVNGREDGDGPKKVQKGQITALAKMLSALRR